MQVFSRIKKRDQDFAIKLIGRGMDKKNKELQEIIRINNLVDDIELIGEKVLIHGVSYMRMAFCCRPLWVKASRTLLLKLLFVDVQS